MILHKRLILIRHANRDTDLPMLDNGLNDKGKKQVKQLVRFAHDKDLEGALFLSSPKKRCVETITPLAEALESTVKIEPNLSEGYSTKNLDAFIEKLKHEDAEVIVACSHGDWIPAFVQRLTGASISIKKAGWCEIELTGNDAFLTWLVQKYE